MIHSKTKKVSRKTKRTRSYKGGAGPNNKYNKIKSQTGNATRKLIPNRRVKFKNNKINVRTYEINKKISDLHPVDRSSTTKPGPILSLEASKFLPKSYINRTQHDANLAHKYALIQRKGKSQRNMYKKLIENNTITNQNKNNLIEKINRNFKGYQNNYNDYNENNYNEYNENNYNENNNYSSNENNYNY